VCERERETVAAKRRAVERRVAAERCKVDVRAVVDQLLHDATVALQEREFFIDNLLVRIHCIIVMIRWTGLAPWEFLPAMSRGATA